MGSGDGHVRVATSPAEARRLRAPRRAPCAPRQAGPHTPGESAVPIRWAGRLGRLSGTRPGPRV